MVSGHFCSGSPVDDRHLGSPATQGGARRVQRGIASSDHEHTTSRRFRTREIHPPQELHATTDALQILPRNAEFPLHVSPDSDENRRVALAQIFERDAAAHRRIQQDVDADRTQPLQFSIQQGPW